MMWREDDTVTVGGGELQGQQLGVFMLQSLLGSGGMAGVYRTLDPRLNRVVAVKVLPPILAADPNYVARFRTEARRVAALNRGALMTVENVWKAIRTSTIAEHDMRT